MQNSTYLLVSVYLRPRSVKINAVGIRSGLHALEAAIHDTGFNLVCAIDINEKVN